MYRYIAAASYSVGRWPQPEGLHHCDWCLANSIQLNQEPCTSCPICNVCECPECGGIDHHLPVHRQRSSQSEYQTCRQVLWETATVFWDCSLYIWRNWFGKLLSNLYKLININLKTIHSTLRQVVVFKVHK